MKTDAGRSQLGRHALEGTDAARQYDELKTYPVKVLQIGEGNFLRGFVDWMVDECNRKGLFRGGIAVTQPRPSGKAKLEQLASQDGIYTLLTRGLLGGKRIEEERLITVFSRMIDPYSAWAEFLGLAESPDLEIVVSNTTEAGIRYEQVAWKPEEPIASFPGKLALLLYRRYEYYKGDPAKGLLILPCELLERNGDELLRIVLQHAEDWKLPASFSSWVRNHNRFLNSLVDRIVTGFPEQAETYYDRWGYEDRMLNATEPYHFWAIEGEPALGERLPFHKAGLNVQWVDDLTPFQTRKVRLLNGTHTLMAAIGRIHGVDEVKQVTEHPVWGPKLKAAMEQELVPSVPISREEALGYAESVWERFRNPFIRHKLADISMNSISKFKVRLLPSLKGYVQLHGVIPPTIAEGLAALIRLHDVIRRDGEWLGQRLDGQRVPVKDDEEALALFEGAWARYRSGELELSGLASDLLGSEKLWDENLNAITGLHEAVCGYLQEMELVER